MLGPGGVSGDEGEVDKGLGDRRELSLGVLGGLEQSLQGLGVVTEIDSIGLLEVVGQVVDDALVELVAALARVTTVVSVRPRPRNGTASDSPRSTQSRPRLTEHVASSMTSPREEGPSADVGAEGVIEPA